MSEPCGGRFLEAKYDSAAWKTFLSFAFAASVLAVLLLFEIDEYLLSLLSWIDTQGVWTPVLFMLIMVGAVVLVLPGVMLTTGAGFVFGVVEGTIYVVVGTTVGAALAFLIARNLLGEGAARFLLEHDRLSILSEKLASKDWKVVMLTRLVPFFPFKLSNYFFGLTSFSLRGFVAGSFLGIIPFSLHNVYLGSIAAEIAIWRTSHTARTPLEWSLYGLGVLVAIGSVLYLSRLARRELAMYTEQEARGSTGCRG
jgi:uncharacterized membrane protein YdjX (TVP38/TMEM64 family)